MMTATDHRIRSGFSFTGTAYLALTPCFTGLYNIFKEVSHER